MIFLNSKHELRSGWKFAAYAVLFFIILFAAGLAFTMVVSGKDLLENQLVLFALNDISLGLAAVGALWLTVRFVDHRPFRTFGIGFPATWRSDLLWGLALAAGMLAALVAGHYLLGYVVIRWTGGQVPAGTLLATFFLLLVAAANEELVFRGFPLQVLIDGIGEWPAMIGMSILFGAVHLNNPNASLLGTVNTVVAGILLSLAYVKTRSLWLPYAIHVGWNLGLGF